VAARVSIPITSFCFKREATRVLLSSKLSIEYEVEKSSVKRENANPSKTRLGKDSKTLYSVDAVESVKDNSESLDDRATDIQRLLAKTSKGMNANYRYAVKKRYKMDDLEWRLQRIFRRLERMSSKQTYLDTVNNVRRLDREYQFIFVKNYEELWSIKG
tara:strand:+ start:5101 stop:5577 length:477 start_codon:yes stop_codon:yes gene_type:complete